MVKEILLYAHTHVLRLITQVTYAYHVHYVPYRRKIMAEKKYVYPFDEAYGLGKELLGGKGAGLAEMTPM